VVHLFFVFVFVLGKISPDDEGKEEERRRRRRNRGGEKKTKVIVFNRGSAWGY
jgi:hypothetical protein